MFANIPHQYQDLDSTMAAVVATRAAAEDLVEVRGPPAAVAKPERRMTSRP